MPREDGTGPLGLGPMTGGGAGRCAGYAIPGFMNPGGGRRFCGRRGGRGFGYVAPVPLYPAYGAPVAYSGASCSPSTTSVEAEMNGLKAQTDFLKQSLDRIARRIKELDGVNREGTE